MEKVIRKTTLKDTQTDYSFWITKTEIERIDAFEFLRTNYINSMKNIPTRRLRVSNIINRN